jgi:hypothetical protein
MLDFVVGKTQILAQRRTQELQAQFEIQMGNPDSIQTVSDKLVDRQGFSPTARV